MVTSQEGLRQLLHQVDQEEAGADHQHGQELHLQALGLGRQALADLREHVEHGGCQEDPATKT